MKTISLVTLFLITSSIAFLAGRYSVSTKQSKLPTYVEGRADFGTPQSGSQPKVVSVISMAAGWQKIQAARETLRDSNPELATRYRALATKIMGQQEAMNQAILNADPQCAAIIAKLKMQQYRNSTFHSKAAAGPAIGVAPDSTAEASGLGKETVSRDSLSPSEWLELGKARQKALKVDPLLAKQKAELSDEVRQFESDLDAAVVAVHPELSAFVHFNTRQKL